MSTRLTFQETKARFQEAARLAGVIILGEYKGIHYSVECLCPKGHTCSPHPSSVFSGRGWCRICAGKDKSLGEARLRELAVLAGAVVVGPYVNNYSPIECICPNGHICTPRPTGIFKGQGWCVICAGRDWESSRAYFFALAARDSIEVIGEFINSATPVKCVCVRGHVCYPRPNNVRKGHSWCSQCIKPIDRMYLVVGEFGGSAWGKFGLASSTVRLVNHRRNGWVLHRQWLNIEHNTAWSIERSVKAVTYALPHLEAIYMPQRGSTETFPFSHLFLIERRVEILLSIQ